MAQPEIELLKIPAEDSTCSVMREQAIIWCDNGNYKGMPWDTSFGDWSLTTKVYAMGELGFSVKCLAVYVGIDKDGFACYVTFDPDF